MKAIILNDTTRAEGHLGCKLVMHNIKYLCEKSNINIILSKKNVSAYKDEDYLKKLESTDIVIVNGEGTMHDDQTEALELIKSIKKAKEKDKKICLVNSIWIDNNILNDYLDLFDLIFVRDSKSQKEIENGGFSAEFVPDLSLYTVSHNRIKGTNIVVTDSVVDEKNTKLIRIALRLKAVFLCMGTAKYNKHMKTWKKRLYKMVYGLKNFDDMHDLDHVGLLVSGRFHAVCVALTSKVPFLFTSSNTRKIEFLLEDMGLNYKDFLFEINKASSSKEELLCKANEIFDKNAIKINNFIEKARFLQEEMFIKISEL